MIATKPILRRGHQAMIGALIVLSSLFFAAVSPAGAGATFAITSWDGDWTIDQAGNAFTQAGGHPYSVVNTFDLTTHLGEDGLIFPDAGLRTVRADLPPGFIGAPNSMPTCASVSDLIPDSNFKPSHCPVSSVVGTIEVDSGGLEAEPYTLSAPLFNMSPSSGAPAQFGFQLIGFPQWLTASLRSDGDFGVTINARNISQGLAVIGVRTTFWGVPADPSHDAQRCAIYEGSGLGAPVCAGEPGTIEGPNPASVGTVKAFLTNPTSCTPPGVGNPIGLHVESWERPSTSDDASFTTHLPGEPSQQIGNTGCQFVPFGPDITVQPSTRQADSPSGLEVNLKVPQEGLDNPKGIAQSNLKKAVVALPEGMTVNPSFADGVAVCSPEQIGLVSSNPPRFNVAEPTCPEASKIGAIHIETALLDDPLDGELVLAESNDPAQAGPENPFDSLVSVYIVARGPGILVKLAGKVSLDPKTGQLITTFDENPPVPFSLFRLSFKGGPRAPLVTPSACGTYTTTAELSPYARPDQPVPDRDSFQITKGPDGGPCPGVGANRPFKPVLKAGTLNNSAGSFSPFVLRMSRGDGEQRRSPPTFPPAWRASWLVLPSALMQRWRRPRPRVARPRRQTLPALPQAE